MREVASTYFFVMWLLYPSAKGCGYQSSYAVWRSIELDFSIFLVWISMEKGKEDSEKYAHKASKRALVICFCIVLSCCIQGYPTP